MGKTSCNGQASKKTKFVAQNLWVKFLNAKTVGNRHLSLHFSVQVDVRGLDEVLLVDDRLGQHRSRQVVQHVRQPGPDGGAERIKQGNNNYF